MSEDLNKKIKQITDILGQESLPDNLKGLLSLLAGSGIGNPGGSSDSSEDSPPKLTEAKQVKEEKPDRKDPDDGIDMMRKMKKVMDTIGTTNNDPRVNLLFALKPFLNNRRQKKLSNCINLLRMSSLARLVDDTDKGDF